MYLNLKMDYKYINLKMTERKKLWISLIILLLSLIFAFYPMKREVTEYEWIPRRDGNILRINLLDLNPDKFEIEMPCNVVKNDWILKSEGGPAFLLEVLNEYLILTTGFAKGDDLIRNSLKLNIQEDNCLLNLEIKENVNAYFQNNSSKSHFKLNNKTKIYLSSHLKINDKIDNSKIKINIVEKDSLNTTNGKDRKIFFVFIFIIIFYYITSNLRIKK